MFFSINGVGQLSNHLQNRGTLTHTFYDIKTNHKMLKNKTTKNDFNTLKRKPNKIFVTLDLAKISVT